MNKYMTALVMVAGLMTATAASAQEWGQGNNVGVGNVGLANGNFNSNGNAASTANGGAGGTGGSGSGGNVTNNNQYKNRVPGAIGAPGLAAGANTCAGSWSVGASFYGGGLGAGKTYEMRNCEARAVSQQLYAYGYRQAAIQVLVNEHPMVRRAMTMTGNARYPQQAKRTR